MEPKKIPTAVAAMAIVEARLRNDLTAAQLLLSIALPALVADLHARGVIDGPALADRLLEQATAPELVAEHPALQALAETLSGRIRDEVSPQERPTASSPPAIR